MRVQACLSADRSLPAHIVFFQMYYVYIISSISRKYVYTGITNNIERRFREHNEGKNKTTKPYAPFMIIFQEAFRSRVDARIKEKYFKSGVGREWVKGNLL